MNEDLKLNDIAEDLLILNKYTIDRLFKLPQCTDCLALYIFYYKTAKWQHTTKPKANDVYVAKSLGWGKNKITKIKKILQENGFIQTIQNRTNGKIAGWYIEIHYYVSDKVTENIKIKVVNNDTTTPKIKNLKIQQVVNSTSCFQDIYALDNNLNTQDNNLNALDNNFDDDDIEGQALKSLETPKESLIDFIENNMHPLTPIEMEVVCQWEDNDLTRYAIKQAVLNNARSIKYIDRVLYNYKKQGITSVQQAIEENEKFQKQKESYKPKPQSKPKANLTFSEINEILKQNE